MLLLAECLWETKLFAECLWEGRNSMPTILNIDYAPFLLPDSVNVNAILKAFEKAEKLEFNGSGREDRYTISDRKLRISVEVVSASQIHDPSKRLPRSRQIPAVASDHCNGDMGVDGRKGQV